MTRFTTVEATRPDWKPLEQHVPHEECAEFMWMHRDGVVHFYKHIITRRYLMLDVDGNCLRWHQGGLQAVDFKPEYLRVTGRE